MHYTIGGELYHHGILGQIHGVRNGPPYPLSRGDHSAKEKKAKWWESLTGGSKKKKNDEDRVTKNEQKNQNEEDEKKKYEEDKERALKSGTATEVLKYQGDLTNNQLMDAITRIEREGRLKSMSESENKTQTLTDKLDGIFNKIDKVRNWAEKGVGAYNITAKIINAISGEDDMPIVGEKKSDKELKELKLKNQKLQNKLIEGNIDLKKQETKKAKELAKQEKLNTKDKKNGVSNDNNKTETKKDEKKETKKEETKETKKEETKKSDKETVKELTEEIKKSEKKETKKSDTSDFDERAYKDDISKVRDKYKNDYAAQNIIDTVVNSDWGSQADMARQIVRDKSSNKKKSEIYEDALRAVGISSTIDAERRLYEWEKEAEKRKKEAGA